MYSRSFYIIGDVATPTTEKIPTKIPALVAVSACWPKIRQGVAAAAAVDLFERGARLHPTVFSTAVVVPR